MTLTPDRDIEQLITLRECLTMPWLATAKDWARRIKLDVNALWIAAHDVRTPVLAKILAAIVTAYALSPLDLIPDFIPVLGYLDDLIIVPLGIMLAVRLIPAPLMTKFRAAALLREQRPVSLAGLAFIVAVWVAVGAFALWCIS